MSIDYDDFSKLDLRVAKILTVEKIHAEFTKGIIKGSKTISLEAKKDGCSLNAKWDIKMSGLAGMFTGMISKHVRSGTEQALESIKQEAESY